MTIVWILALGFALLVTTAILARHMGERAERMRWYVLLSSPDITDEWEPQNFQCCARSILLDGWPDHEEEK